MFLKIYKDFIRIPFVEVIDDILFVVLEWY